MKACKTCNCVSYGYHDCFNQVVNNVGLNRRQIELLEGIYLDGIRELGGSIEELDEYTRKFDQLCEIFHLLMEAG